MSDQSDDRFGSESIESTENRWEYSWKLFLTLKYVVSVALNQTFRHICRLFDKWLSLPNIHSMPQSIGKTVCSLCNRFLETFVRIFNIFNEKKWKQFNEWMELFAKFLIYYYWLCDFSRNIRTLRTLGTKSEANVDLIMWVKRINSKVENNDSDDWEEPQGWDKRMTYGRQKNRLKT